jgi:hypothetical protein
VLYIISNEQIMPPPPLSHFNHSAFTSYWENFLLCSLLLNCVSGMQEQDGSHTVPGGKAVSLRRSARVASNRSVSSVSLSVEGGGGRGASEGQGGRRGERGRSRGRGRGRGRGEGGPSSRSPSSSSSLVPSPSLPAQLPPPLISRRNDVDIVTAAEEGNLAEVMRLYQKDNVSLDSTDDGWTALMRSSGANQLPVVKFLVRNGAVLDTTNGGYTALLFAAVFGHERVLRCLIDAGADMNARDDEGYTPLIHAVSKDYRSCVGRLLMEGADDTLLANEGFSAFDVAVAFNRPYGVIDTWEGMKARVSESDIMMALRCALAARNAPAVERPTTLLQNFFQRLSIAETSKIMMQIVSLWCGWDPASGADYDADVDPSFIDRDSAEYVQFARGVVKGLSSIMDSSARKDKSVDFFLPFVNAGGSKAFSRQRAVSMMKVLANDGKEYDFGEDLDAEENPFELNLRGLDYAEGRGLVSLREVDEVDEVDDGDDGDDGDDE